MPRGADEFSPRERALLTSLTGAGPGFCALVGVLLAFIAWGIIAYAVQLRHGLGVTGLRDNFMWGVYITNFVFFIGISHVGALMSAILRITGAEWRRPITSMAEAITFASLLMGALMPIVDMGRPDRFFNLLLHGRLQSPVLWDILSIATYLTGSTLFLYVPMIPDIALLRDHFAQGPTWRRRLYSILALGWRGTEAQRHILERIMGIMAVLIIPIAVSVHTVVSWIFGMTLRAGWNSTIFGPYFVSGALFSGAAAVVTAMGAFRWAYRLEEYITEAHFRRMGYLLIALGMVYAYFTFAEYLTPAYKMATPERGYLSAVFSGRFSGVFWFTQAVGILLPVVLLTLPRVKGVLRLAQVPALRPATALPATAVSVAVGLLMPAVLARIAPLSNLAAVWQIRTWVVATSAGWLFVTLLPVFHQRPIAAAVVASALVNVGAWLKRFVIIVPTLQYPFLPIQHAPAGWDIYQPTWVEWSITAGALAGFVLIYVLFSKLFPIVPIWETREEGHLPPPTPAHAGQGRVSPGRPLANLLSCVVLATILAALCTPAAAMPTRVLLHSQTRADGTVQVMATVLDAEGKPAGGVRVVFKARTAFGWLTVHEATTDREGRARAGLPLGRLPREVAVEAGDEGETRAALLLREREPVPASTRPGREVLREISPQPGLISPYPVPLQVTLLGLVLGGIWSTYGYVLWLLLHMARDGQASVGSR